MADYINNEIARVKEKIKKLLTLSADTNYDAESQAAIQRAQILMAKYKLEEKDINLDEKKKVCIKKKTALCYGVRSSDQYMNDLAEIIADNFCCVNYISRTRGTQTYSVSFMGLDDDVEIAVEVLYTANRAIVKGYNKVYKDLCNEYHASYIPTRIFNPAKLGYIGGYLKGLKEALESQKEANQQEWGLVLVAPQEAKDFISNLSEANYSTTTHADYKYYDEGYSDGKDFHLLTKLNNPDISNKLTD